MPSQYKTISHTTERGVTLRNRHWVGNGTALVVLLPGQGYTLDGALLRYTAQAASQRGADVFGIEYPFHSTGGNFDRGDAPNLLQNVTAALEDFRDTQRAREQHVFQKIVLVGKSLGTGIASAMTDTAGNVVGRILLTPVPGALTDGPPALAVIGTADPFYDNLREQIDHPPSGTRWAVFDNVNHSLEHPDDWRQTLHVLTHTINVCDQFLAEVL